MRRKFFYLFLLIFSSFGLFSCGDSDDDTIDDTTPYKVTINLTGIPYGVDNATASSKVDVAEGRNILQYVIYKESGEVVAKERLFGNSIPKSFTINEELVSGKYYFAIGSGVNYMMTSWLWNASNLSTDYCSGNSLIMGNGNIDDIYFGSLDIEIDKSSSNEFNVDLEDLLNNMGDLLSTVKVDITNYESYDFPDCIIEVMGEKFNTLSIAYEIETSHQGFSIKTKQPMNVEKIIKPSHFDLLPIDTFKENKGILALQDLTGADNVKISILLVDKAPMGDTELERHVIYEGKLEGSKNVTFKGQLGQSLPFQKVVE